MVLLNPEQAERLTDREKAALIFRKQRQKTLSEEQKKKIADASAEETKELWPEYPTRKP
jgi:hypothetical protein